MALAHLSAYNGYIPALTGQVIGFARKPEKFKLNRYVQYMPSDKQIGVYTRLERDVMVRITSIDDDVWEDGDNRPSGEHGVKVKHSTDSFQCIRRDLAWRVGYNALDQTKAYPVKPVHVQSTVSQTMTRRTKRVWNILDSTSNWSTHFKTAGELSNISGADNAKWKNASDDPASPAYLAIWKSLNGAIQRIFKDTNSAVEWSDLILVINPELAADMAQSAEMNNYIRESPQARAQLSGELSNWNKEWGLPTHVRGLALVVEDAMMVSGKEYADGTEATTERTFIKSGSSAQILSRPGGLDGELSVPS